MGTSHQLLKHYLDDLERWKADQNYRNAKRQIAETHARAEAENRPMTEWEARQVNAWDWTAMRHKVAAGFFKRIEKIRKKASQQGYLDQWQVKMLKVFAGLPGAEETLPLPNEASAWSVLELSGCMSAVSCVDSADAPNISKI
jgi:hypothetical protein